MSRHRGQLDGSSLARYLREISAHPLLSRKEEMALAARMRAGCDEARERLVLSNLRFVVSVAKRFQNRRVGLGDLISAGNVGLIRAALGFDETKGVKFISYAVWWIRRAILGALADQGRIVRVPLKRGSALHRVGRCSSTLLQQTGREPTVEEIADELGLSREEVQCALTVSQSHASLDAPSRASTGTAGSRISCPISSRRAPIAKSASGLSPPPSRPPWVRSRSERFRSSGCILACRTGGIR